MIWPGKDGDVQARGFRVECKYRTDMRLDSRMTLRDWIEQAERNSAKSKYPWILAITGGKSWHNAAGYVLMPFETFDRLTRFEESRLAWEHFKQRHSDSLSRIDEIIMFMLNDYREFGEDAI